MRYFTQKLNQKQHDMKEVRHLRFMGGCDNRGGDNLNQLKEAGSWTCSAYVDSGALDCVAPKEGLPEFEMKSSVGIRRGHQYVTANGPQICNEGEQRVEALTDRHKPVKMKYQVAEVTKALCSVG